MVNLGDRVSDRFHCLMLARVFWHSLAETDLRVFGECHGGFGISLSLRLKGRSTELMLRIGGPCPQINCLRRAVGTFAAARQGATGFSLLEFQALTNQKQKWSF